MLVGDERPEGGPDLQEVVGEAAVVLVARGFPSRFFGEGAEFGLDGSDLVGEPGAVLVFAVVVPGLEEAAGELEALLAELLSGWGALRRGSGSLSLQVAPAGLAAFGVDVGGVPASG